jgi:phosphoribosyl 1,2-cyclic phosphodiesterase
LLAGRPDADASPDKPGCALSQHKRCWPDGPMLTHRQPSRGVRFCPLASGSSGNCVYVSLNGRHFLIDAGISGKRIQKSMAYTGIPHIDGIFVTHEHSDHISSVGALSRRFNIPVYATPLTWRYFLRHKTIGPIAEHHVKMLDPYRPADVQGVEVTAFEVSHDATQPVGYSLYAGGVKVTVATDIGDVTDTLREHLRGSNIMLLESNHDVEMLKNGKYPKMLKERVLSSRGHLSNANAGVLLAEVAHEGLEYAFLGHLSEENNRPLIAMDTVQMILESRNIFIKYLAVADRHEPSEMIEI